VYRLVDAPSDIVQVWLSSYSPHLLAFDSHMLEVGYELDTMERWYLVNRIAGVVLSVC
jgi:hypothetical protein